MYHSIINYKGARYLWVAIIVSSCSALAYWLDRPIGAPNGGTWLGYTLGTIGAALIIWLMLLGIRKRSYNSNLGSVQGWTSAHVYLGTALLLVATLHCGFQFGVNVHTSAYLLMVAVILSGFFGIYAYIRYPNLMTENRAGDTLQGLMEQVQTIDERCIRNIAKIESYDLHTLVESAIKGCSIGGSWWQQLRCKDSSTISTPSSIDLNRSNDIKSQAKTHSNVDQQHIIDALANRLSQISGDEEAGVIQGLLANFATKQTLLRRLRRDIQIRALLKIWLYIHVPLSFGLLAALTTHIIVVFYYW